MAAARPFIQFCTRTKVAILFTKRFSHLFHPLCLNIVREIADYIGFHRYLPAIFGHYLYLFDIFSGSKVEYRLSEAYRQGTLFCAISEVDILAVGGYSPMVDLPDCQKLMFESMGGKSVRRLNLLTFLIETQPDLLQSRMWPGLIRHRAYIYVFGSLTEKSRLSCEKYHIYEKRWSMVPNLAYPQACFSPCCSAGEIYVSVAAPGSVSLAVLNPVIEEYRLVALTLRCLYFWSLSYVSDGEVIYLSPGRAVEVLTIEEGKRTVGKRRKSVVWMGETPVMPAVRVGEGIYCASRVYGLSRFDLKTR